MKIITIAFNTSKLNTLISFIFSKIFKKVNLHIFPNLEKKSFNYEFKLKKNDVLIKNILCGYCGTDRKILSFDMSLFSSAFLDSKKHKKKRIYLGHELVGKVVEVGSNVKKIKKNDKVIMDSATRKVDRLKNNLFGGFSNYLVRDQSQLETIDKNLPYNKAILIEPLACSLGAIKKVAINKNDRILIIGGGIIGQGIAHLLRYNYGKKIKIFLATNSHVHFSMINRSIVDKIIFQKDLFDESEKILNSKLKQKFHNKIIENGYDKIFECSGSNEIINKSLRLTSKNAEIVLVGMNMNYVKIDPTPIWHRNLNIKGSLDFKYKYPDIKKPTLVYIHDIIKNKKLKLNNFKIKKIKINNWKNLFNNNDYNSIKKALTFN
jgi:2-desacetyl-2-hydroxyethyl bacteriochlorophyllide A dehydrogenase